MSCQNVLFTFLDSLANAAAACLVAVHQVLPAATFFYLADNAASSLVGCLFGLVVWLGRSFVRLACTLLVNISNLPFVADGLDDTAAACLVAVCQTLQVCCSDARQQRLGEMCFVLSPHNKVLILEMPHILIPQVLPESKNSQTVSKHTGPAQCQPS